MVPSCWERFEHAVHLTPPSYHALNGQSTPPCRAGLGASHFIEKQEMDVVGTHVPAQKVHCFTLTDIYNL